VKLDNVELGTAESKKKQLAKRHASLAALKSLSSPKARPQAEEVKAPSTPQTDASPVVLSISPVKSMSTANKRVQVKSWQAEFDPRELLQR
jgi:hypothetical protein